MSRLYSQHLLEIRCELVSDIRLCVIAECQPCHQLVHLSCYESTRQILFPSLPHEKRHFLHVAEYGPQKQCLVRVVCYAPSYCLGKKIIEVKTKSIFSKKRRINYLLLHHRT